MKLVYPSILAQYWHDLWVYKRATAQRTRTSYEQNSIKPTLPHLRRVLGAAPLSHASIPEDEGNYPLTPQMIVLKIAKLQALIKQRTTSSISKHYTPAESRTPLLALRTCPPSSFLGFLEINNFEFFHSTILKFVQTPTCAGKLAPPATSTQQFLLQQHSQRCRTKCIVDSDKEKERWSLVTPNDKLLLAPPTLFGATVDAKVTEFLRAVFGFYCKRNDEITCIVT